jgi:hypothetical protein
MMLLAQLCMRSVLCSARGVATALESPPGFFASPSTGLISTKIALLAGGREPLRASVTLFFF